MNKNKRFKRIIRRIQNQESWKLALYATGIILIFIAILTFPEAVSHIEAQEVVMPAPPPKPTVDYFASTTIQAAAAYVYDINAQKVLFAKNADEPLPLASITKLMTMITAMQSAPTSTVVTITPSSLATDGDSGLYDQEKWTLQKLLSFTLVVSSNDGAAAVAEALGDHPASDAPAAADQSREDFVSSMNANALKLGLSESRFYNESGLDISTTQAGAYGSAKDVEKLLTYALATYPDIVDLTSQPGITETSLSNITHTGQNTDVLTSQIPGMVAGKTGYTDLAGGNLAVIVNVVPDNPVAVVVLGSTYDGRFSDVAALIADAKKAVIDRISI
jgi:D-alanyl-D-alanine carboxypeptidase (penicillin-binding protein 5/6)